MDTPVLLLNQNYEPLNVCRVRRAIVLLAKGKPSKKVRDFNDGIETEDWIYGLPPGDIIFVTFEDDEVIKIKEAHAKLGGLVKQDVDPNEEK